MCVQATTALTIVSALSSYGQYQAGKQQQKNAYEAQKRTNKLAKENAIQRYAAEQLRIRQVLTASAQKGYQASLKARKARATFITEAGDAGGLALSGSTNALLANYYRTEGKYQTSLQNNMGINISQFERNMEAIQFGQKSQSVYEQPPNSALLFASSAMNVANTYYGLEAQKELYGYKSNRNKSDQRKRFVETYSV
jgi:hypothetical protein